MARTSCLPCCPLVALHRCVAVPEVVVVEPQGSPSPTAGTGLVIFRMSLALGGRPTKAAGLLLPGYVDEALKQTLPWPLVQSGGVSAKRCYTPHRPPTWFSMPAETARQPEVLHCLEPPITHLLIKKPLHFQNTAIALFEVTAIITLQKIHS